MDSQGDPLADQGTVDGGRGRRRNHR
jgi:hypothetical protein